METVISTKSKATGIKHDIYNTGMNLILCLRHTSNLATFATFLVTVSRPEGFSSDRDEDGTKAVSDRSH